MDTMGGIVHLVSLAQGLESLDEGKWEQETGRENGQQMTCIIDITEWLADAL